MDAVAYEESVGHHLLLADTTVPVVAVVCAHGDAYAVAPLVHLIALVASADLGGLVAAFALRLLSA